jgi:hypothetical protein
MVGVSEVHDDTAGMFSIDFNHQGAIQAYVTDEPLVSDKAATGQML